MTSGPFIGSYKSRVIVDHSADGLRAGEGSLVVLSDGTLYLAYSEFSGGGADHSAAYIAVMESKDGGSSWSVPRPLFMPPPSALNAMGVSLLRLQDGRIGCIFAIKHSLGRLTPHWSVSADEGGAWSTPKPITSDAGYFVINNDRLIQHRDGTLILPYALHIDIDGGERYESWNPAWNARCGLFYSRDGGESWRRSPHWITHTPDLFHEPLFIDPAVLENPAIKSQFANRLGVFQEPGVQELGAGSLMLHMRSSYGIYRCFASGVEARWEDCRPFPGIHSCMSPQTIRTIPGSDDLVMLYNDRGNFPFGAKEFTNRTPLTVAISEDSGLSWKRVGELEDSRKNYCYVSFRFHGEQFFATYYESAPQTLEDGSESRRNLASLKFGRGTWRKRPSI